MLGNHNKKTEIDRFDKIYADNITGVVNFVSRMINDKEKVNDLVQEIFIRVFQNIRKLKHEFEKPWLFTISRNVVYDYLRKQKVINEYIDIIDNVDSLNSPENSPEFNLLNSELRDRLESAIEELPFKLKEVFLLRFEAGLKFKEISSILNCPVNRLLGRMHMAIKQIRSDLNVYLKEEVNEL
jgi:RNA polymerase sigma-70 factor, ECF subfamily